MVLFIDVTERRKLEAQLQQALKIEAVGQLAGGVAHDFNNLLQVIQGYSELLYERVPEDDCARGWIEEVLRAAHRASSLTGQLLALSRKQVLRPIVMDINSVVESTIKMMKRLLPESITINRELETALWRSEADPDQITHVLINFGLNAQAAMPRGGTLTIATRNQTISSEMPGIPQNVKSGEYVVMTVRD